MQSTQQERWSVIQHHGEPSLVDAAAEQADEEIALDHGSLSENDPLYDQWFEHAIAAYLAQLDIEDVGSVVLWTGNVQVRTVSLPFADRGEQWEQRCERAYAFAHTLLAAHGTPITSDAIAPVELREGNEYSVGVQIGDHLLISIRFDDGGNA